jgi:hypothetical protein
MKTISLGLLFIFSFQLTMYSQSISNSLAMLQDLNGSPLKLGNARNVDGNPFFKTNFCEANLITGDGKMFSKVRTKLNLQNNIVIYTKSELDENEFSPTVQIKQIQFIGCADSKGVPVFESGFPPIGNQDESVFYQVLDAGNTKLLKYFQIDETQNAANGLNPGAPAIQLQKVEFYFAFNSLKGIQKLSNSTSAILQYFSDKKLLIETFITTNKLKCKKEDELIKVFNYYNSLN